VLFVKFYGAPYTNSTPPLVGVLDKPSSFFYRSLKNEIQGQSPEIPVKSRFFREIGFQICNMRGFLKVRYITTPPEMTKKYNIQGSGLDFYFLL